jgi:valyl-tRNA synthetase
VAISGWGIAPEGTGKISKSRGGGPMSPLEMIGHHSADAVRYWAASTGPGKDSIISEEKVQAGARLVTKLWNVARFSERFVEGYRPPLQIPALSPADRWILSRTQGLIRRVTGLFQAYDYAAAKSEVESFFWRDLADNYLEMAKLRLYEPGRADRESACYALHQALLTLLKLFAPILPYVTEEVYRGLFAECGEESIHRSRWPAADERLEDASAEAAGETLVSIATAVRRYKSEHNLPLGSEVALLQLATADAAVAAMLRQAEADLASITRARGIAVVEQLSPDLESLELAGSVAAALRR